ncbi:MAG TPA: DUF6766 family protein [Caulobacteraceae bacterium]
MKRNFWRDNGLTIALMGLFLASIVGHALAGWGYYNHQQIEHHQPPAGLIHYLASGQFISSVFENWESEFLQMSVYVVLTAFLYQRGSPESDDPDISPQARKGQTTRQRNAALEKVGGNRVLLWLYANSLGLALFALFLLSFVLHLLGSTKEAAEDALSHGQLPPSVLNHLVSAEFWFQSFQNWQSEFLSVAALVVLGIFLRQENSPESKPLSEPNSKTGG